MDELIQPPLPAEATERYALSARRELLPVLEAIAATRVPVEIDVLQLNRVIESRLLSLKPAFEELVFDVAGLEGLELLDGSAGVRVKAQLDTIWFSFEAPYAEMARGWDRPALRARIPDLMRRMQRRDSVRYPVPAINSPILDVRGPGEWDEVEHLRVMDISLSGIGLTIREDQRMREVDSLMKGCTLHLPGIGAMNLDLHVAYVSQNKDGERRLGGRFTNMLATSLSHLRRYVMRLERERLKAMSGMRVSSR